MNDDKAQLKQQAAERAIAYVESGMVVGLGHGSTARYAVQGIARLLNEERLRDILGIPCSRLVEQEANRLGIPLTSLNEHPVIDLTIDGADEVSPRLEIIKGGGGALLREKIVAQASRREIIIIDESKCSPIIGTLSPVPVEVIPFGWRPLVSYLQSLKARVEMRMAPDGTPFCTDEGNYILDCHFGPIARPAELAACLQDRAGIVAHGLFLGLATEAIVADQEGLRVLKNDREDM